VLGVPGADVVVGSVADVVVFTVPEVSVVVELV
jgi:hypothetical protein